MRAVEVQTAVLVGGAIQEVKYGTAFLVLATLGVGALRTGASHARRGGRGKKPRIVSTAG
jgi:hypothetical protein